MTASLAPLLHHLHRPAIAGLLWLALSSLASAECQCLWQGSFVDTAPQADLIAVVTPMWQQGNAMDVTIEQLISGREFLPTIRIWGQYPGTCRPELAPFMQQPRWILALKRIDEVAADGFNPNTPGISFGRKGDYYLSACGANWLQVSDGFAKGNIINGSRWQWENPENKPVIVELLAAYLQQALPREAIAEAAKPDTASKKLMRETLRFLEQNTSP